MQYRHRQDLVLQRSDMVVSLVLAVRTDYVRLCGRLYVTF